MQRTREGKSRPASPRGSRPQGRWAAFLALEPAAGASGGIGSPHGAEFKHGPAPIGDGLVDRGFSSSGPQQHAAFLHLTPQPQ